MNSPSRFTIQIPRDVSLNPQFETITLKMKDLFLQFISNPAKRALIGKLIDSAQTSTLKSSEHPSALQIDALPSFTTPAKNMLNNPPVARRRDKHSSMSYTMGPTPRNNKTNEQESSVNPVPTMMSTLDLTRSNQIIPPLKDLLQIALEINNSIAKEITLSNLLNEVQLRDISLITSETTVSPIYEKICRDILAINSLFARTLERKVGHLKSQNRQNRICKTVEIINFKNEQIPNCL